MTLAPDTIHRAAEAGVVAQRRHDQRLAEAYLSRRGWQLHDDTPRLHLDSNWRTAPGTPWLHWQQALGQQLREDLDAVADSITAGLLAESEHAHV